ncbi:14275_t:CDS:2, partial [Dentiscutata heterogama]
KQDVFTTSNIRLICFVRGEAEEDIFPIVIDNNTTVENLGVEIRNVRRDLNQKNFDLYVRKFKQINHIEELKKKPPYPQYDEIGPIHVIIRNNNNCEEFVPIVESLIYWNRVLGICWEFVFGEI